MFANGNVSTEDSMNEEKDLTSVYIGCSITGCVILASTIYIFICLLVYGRKTGKWNPCRSGADVNRSVVYIAAVIAVSLGIPRYLSTQLVIYIQYIPNGTQYCEVLLDAANVFCFVAMAAVYIFLWIRQRVLYEHPAMQRLAGKYVNFISWATLVILTSAALAVLLWFSIPDDYTYSKQGCVVIPVSDNATDEALSYGVYYIALLGLLVIAQILLLGLFVYPMIRSSAIQNESLRRHSRHKSLLSTSEDTKFDNARKGSSQVLTSPKRVKRSASRRGQKNTVKRTIRRAVICAAIAMASDFVTMLAASFALPPDMSRAMNNTVFDIGLFISGLCILGTFSDYQTVFLIICKADHPSNTNETSRGTENTSVGQHTFKSDDVISDRQSSLREISEKREDAVR